MDGPAVFIGFALFEIHSFVTDDAAWKKTFVEHGLPPGRDGPTLNAAVDRRLSSIAHGDRSEFSTPGRSFFS
jgi:hypothetical protein